MTITIVCQKNKYYTYTISDQFNMHTHIEEKWFALITGMKKQIK